MREFWRQLPTEGRWLLSTVAVQTLGRGLTLPFTIIYLHEVRGFDLGLSGTLMGLIAITALVVTGPSGMLTDRVGARVVLMAGLSSMIVGCVTLAFATHPAVAAVGLVLIGINFGSGWPAFNAMIASIVQGELRQKYFGINFALVNLGIGVGGIVGGLYVDVSDARTFTTIFLLDAASVLVPMALLIGPLRHVRTAVEHDGVDGAAPVTYLSILRQPAVAWLTALTFVAVFVGYGQHEAGFPAYAREVVAVSTRTVGLSFAVNTAVIVALQFLVLNKISGHRRTRVMLVMAGVWAASWLLLGATGLLPGTLVAAIGVLAYMGVFAFGETLMQPTIPAICNDLASDHTRGRYNAINAGAFQLGAIAGPIAAGLLLDHGLDEAYIALLVAGCVSICAMALALERRIPAAANGAVEELPAPATPTAAPGATP